MDTITLNNGDRVTGEIKSLDRGKLSYSTSPMGSIDVKWNRVIRIESPRFFEVRVASGRRHYGALAAIPEQPGAVDIHVAQFHDTVVLAQVVEIAPIGAGFVQRLDGYVNLGWTLAKANDNRQTTFGAEVRYRPPGWTARVTTDFYYQDQDPGVPNARASLGLLGLKSVGLRWFVGALGGSERNDETGLVLRASGGAGAGLAVLSSNQVEIATYASVTYTNEDFVGAAPTDGAEAAFSVEGDVFKFGDQTLDGSLRVSAFPNLTDWGRVRYQTDARVSYEILRDFTIGLTFYYTYDNRPPGGTGPVSDYASSFTIGWKY